jgi:hypothetical protein
MTRLRLNGPPSAVRVVLALAILSAMTSLRSLSTAKPEAAMLIDENNPMA